MGSEKKLLLEHKKGQNSEFYKKLLSEYTGLQKYPDLNFKFPPSHKKFVEKHKYHEKVPESILPIKLLGWNHVTILRYLEISFCAIFLFIPRLILLITACLLMNIIGHLTLLGTTRGQPPRPEAVGIRAPFRALCIFLLRVCYFAMGVHWVKDVGKPESAKKAPIRVIAPHSFMMDSCSGVTFPWGIGRRILSPVARADMAKIIPLGLHASLLIDPSSKTSRQDITNEILKRAAELENDSVDWYPIMIYPEGTCGNRTALMSFKAGAFLPGLPVQPCYVEFKDDPDTKSWAWIQDDYQPSAAKLVFHYLLRLDSSFTLHYLPVYNPSQAEKEDPELYAFNVRKAMAIYGKVPTIDICVEDTRLMMHFLYKHKGDPNFAMVEVLRLFKTYKASYRVVQGVLDGYMKLYEAIVNKRTGEMKIVDFVKETGIDEGWLKKHYFHSELGHYSPEFSDCVSMGLYIEAALNKRAEIENNLGSIIEKMSVEKGDLLKEFCKKSLPLLNHDEFDTKEEAEKELLRRCLLQCPEFCYFLEEN